MLREEVECQNYITTMTDQNTERCGEDIISPDRRSRKRPLHLADSSTEGSEMKKTSTRLEVSDSEQPDPAYGTKDYWEMRYKGFKDGDPTKKEAPEAQHSWYFTYEDLSPLLLPLVVGDEIYSIPSSEREKSKQEQDCTEEKVETAQQSSGNEIVEIDPINEFNFEDTMVEETDSDSGDEGEESIEEIDDEEGEEEDSEIPERPGLAKGGPIEVLEIGCGDVPLGTGLLAGIAELESRGLTTTNETLKRVTCMDYSKHVIDDMKVKQKLGTFGGGPLTFECADARKLPYKNESFKLVLEKGTMDAMLSDKESGGDNCRDIVAEMARVLSSGGRKSLL